jgi:hypothetical protein
MTKRPPSEPAQQAVADRVVGGAYPAAPTRRGLALAYSVPTLIYDAGSDA